MRHCVTSIGTIYETGRNECEWWPSRTKLAHFNCSFEQVVFDVKFQSKNKAACKMVSAAFSENQYPHTYKVGRVAIYNPTVLTQSIIHERTRNILGATLYDLRGLPQIYETSALNKPRGWFVENSNVMLNTFYYEEALSEDPVRRYLIEASRAMFQELSIDMTVILSVINSFINSERKSEKLYSQAIREPLKFITSLELWNIIRAIQSKVETKDVVLEVLCNVVSMVLTADPFLEYLPQNVWQGRLLSELKNHLNKRVV